MRVRGSRVRASPWRPASRGQAPQRSLDISTVSISPISPKYGQLWNFLHPWRPRGDAQSVRRRNLLRPEVQVCDRRHPGFDWESRYRHWGEHWNRERDGQGISCGQIAG